MCSSVSISLLIQAVSYMFGSARVDEQSIPASFCSVMQVTYMISVRGSPLRRILQDGMMRWSMILDAL